MTKRSADSPSQGHNSGDLTPAEKSALRMDYIRKLLKVEADMKPFRDLRKQIRAAAKGDGFKLSEIDAGMRLATMEDTSIFVAEIRDLIAIAQAFNALPPGEQGELFPDRRPQDERWFAEGRVAGLAGKNPEPPYGADTDAGQHWMKGWHAGQQSMRDDLEAAMTKRNAKKDELIQQDREPFPDQLEAAE